MSLLKEAKNLATSVQELRGEEVTQLRTDLRILKISYTDDLKTLKTKIKISKEIIKQRKTESRIVNSDALYKKVRKHEKPLVNELLNKNSDELKSIIGESIMQIETITDLMNQDSQIVEVKDSLLRLTEPLIEQKKEAINSIIILSGEDVEDVDVSVEIPF
jgi:hypothetical protein